MLGVDVCVCVGGGGGGGGSADIIYFRCDRSSGWSLADLQWLLHHGRYWSQQLPDAGPTVFNPLTAGAQYIRVFNFY